jgi:hypothetical protein
MWIASIIGTNTRTGQGWRIQAIVILQGMRLHGSAP